MDILTTRQQEIVSILNEKEQLSVNDMAEHFSVTPATISASRILKEDRSFLA